jgi:hypothetical protein
MIAFFVLLLGIAIIGAQIAEQRDAYYQKRRDHFRSRKF